MVLSSKLYFSSYGISANPVIYLVNVKLFHCSVNQNTRLIFSLVIFLESNEEMIKGWRSHDIINITSLVAHVITADTSIQS